MLQIDFILPLTFEQEVSKASRVPNAKLWSELIESHCWNDEFLHVFGASNCSIVCNSRNRDREAKLDNVATSSKTILGMFNRARDRDPNSIR